MSVPAAAPPPAPPPAPATPPATPAAPETLAGDPFLKSLFHDLGVVLAAPVTPAPPPAAPAEDPFLANLIPEERQVYDLAKWAEENSLEYKGQGLSGKFLNFYKAVDQYITTERQKDPQRTFDDKDEAFQTFVESARP